MPGNTNRRTQFIGYVGITYLAAISSLYIILESSITFLQATLKAMEGLHMIIWCNFVLLNSILFWKVLNRILFGELRLIEFEHILERISFTVLNSVFIASMFKEQDFIAVIIYTLILIFNKVFHWILRDRLDLLFQSNNSTAHWWTLLYSGFFFNLVVFSFVDWMLILNCWEHSLDSAKNTSASVYLMFGIEFALLLSDILNIGLLACLNLYELYKLHQFTAGRTIDGESEEFLGLEGKFVYEKVIDISIRLIKMFLHIILLVPFHMPMTVLKDVIFDAISLYQNITSIYKIWKNNKKLDEKLQDANDAELTSTGSICIVCMDDCLPFSQIDHSNHKVKKLPCNHFLHLNCLKSWMERSQTCPICRLPVFDEHGNIRETENTQPQEDYSWQTQMTIQHPETNIDENDIETMSEMNHHTFASATTRDIPPCNDSDQYISFPIESNNDNKIVFRVKDIENNETMITLTRKSHNNLNNGVVIVENPIEMQNIDIIKSYKNKISELEGKIKELSTQVTQE